MGILLGNNMSPVMEAYYGKSKELKICEREFEKIIHAIKTDGKIDGKPIQKSDSIRIIETNIAKKFNLKKFSLYIVDPSPVDINPFSEYPITPTIPQPNAYTFPIVFTSIPGLGEDYMKSKKASVNTTIHKSLIYKYNLTAEEIVAVMLHEIGHNFDHSVFTAISRLIPWSLFRIPDLNISHILTYIGFSVAMPFLGKASLVTAKKASEIMESKIPGFAKFYTKAVSVVSDLYVMYREFTGAIHVLNPLAWIVGLYNTLLPENFFGYASEKYADSFASAHGYSVALSSGMKKLGGNTAKRTMLDKVPFFSLTYDIARVSASMPFLFADVHPSSSVRVYSQLKKMERELNDPSVPKELKPEIKKQIVELKKQVEEIIDIKSDYNKSSYASAIMNTILVGTFKGNLDPREMLENIWRHEA